MTANAHERYLELLAGHALEVLDAEDRRAVDEHLASGCGECRMALLEAEEVASDLALAMPAVAPPDSVRRRLLERVAQDLERRPPRKSGRFVTVLAAAAGLAAVGLGVRAWILESRVAEERRARERVEAELSALMVTLDAFTSPDTRAVSLSGQGATPEARAKAFLDPERGRLFLYVYDLPELPPERTYQLWLIIDGSPVSIGVFDVDPVGSGRLDADRVPSFEGDVTVAVTIEPEGGVPQPTGPMVLLGS